MSSPYIISASRREDIPAFENRVKWFLDSLEEGKLSMVGFYQNYEITTDKLKLIVFWTKNPRPLMEHMDKISFEYYFQFTLNDYPEYELNVPPLLERIETFKELSKKIGKKRVIWRFDPIIVDNLIGVENLLNRIKKIGDQLYPYTEKLVFSFIDPYKKLGFEFKDIPDDAKVQISKHLIEFNKEWGLELATCAESINLDGIKHNKCIDPELIQDICGKQRWIADTKDKGQRPLCGCMISGDVGTFKTCEHKCLYCYAQ